MSITTPPNFATVGVHDGSAETIILGSALAASIVKVGATLSVSKRPPTQTDDESAGYPAHSLWRDNNVAHVSGNSTIGKAVWVPVPDSRTLPLDVFLETGRSPVVAYSTRKLTTTYTANKCIDVQRTSDGAVITVGFVGNLLDTATLDAFCAGTVGRVSRWYDQSGHGNDATETEQTQQPRLDPSCVIGNSRALVFDALINGGSASVPTYSGPTSRMEMPTGVSLDRSNMSITFIGRSRSCQRPGVFFSLNSAASKWLTVAGAFPPGSGAAQQKVGVCIEGTGILSGPKAASEDAAICEISSSANGGFYQWYSDRFNSTAPVTSDALAGGIIGGSQYGVGGHVELSDLIMWPHYKTFNDVAAMHASLYQSADIFPQVRTNIVWDGDSITDGALAVADQTYPRQARALISTDCNNYNVSLFGDVLIQRVTNYAGFVAPLYDPLAPRNVLMQQAGTNDIVINNISAAALYAAAKNYAALARATGFKIIVCTILPRAGFNTAQQAAWSGFNALLRDGWSTFADGLCDFQADPTMGSMAAASNTSLYADGIHPTPLGCSYMANVAAAAVNKLL